MSTQTFLRESVLKNLDVIAHLLHIDAGPDTTREEQLADIICLLLFKAYHSEVENPLSVFKRRFVNGDFRSLQFSEDPDDLLPWREPMDKDARNAARAQAEADAVYWCGNTWLSPTGIVRSVVLHS